MENFAKAALEESEKLKQELDDLKEENKKLKEEIKRLTEENAKNGVPGIRLDVDPRVRTFLEDLLQK